MSPGHEIVSTGGLLHSCRLCLLDVSNGCYRNLNVVSSNLDILTALSFLLLLSSGVYPPSPPTEVPRVPSSPSRASHVYPLLALISVNKLYVQWIHPSAPAAPHHSVGTVATKAQDRGPGGHSQQYDPEHVPHFSKPVSSLVK